MTSDNRARLRVAALIFVMVNAVVFGVGLVTVLTTPELSQHAFLWGDNEPYSGALEGDTLNMHGTRRGLAHALIEIRQDLIAHKTGVDEWIERLVRVLEPILNEPMLRRLAPV